METPEVRYTTSGEVHIAYQCVGDGVVDVVGAMPSVTHLGVWWEWPPIVEFFRGMTEFSRFILFDKRGVGMSDRIVGVPPLAERVDDIRAVMDAVGSKKAVILGLSESSAMSILFAALHPERTLGLVLAGPYARTLWAPDYPWGSRKEDHDEFIRRMEREWATPGFSDAWAIGRAPSRAHDREYLRWVRRMFTYGGSPATAAALERMDAEIDVRPELGSVHVPTLVFAAEGDRNLESSRYIAERIPGAKMVVIPGGDHIFPADPRANKAALEAIRAFVDELPGSLETNRVLTTVLFTDIVGSTRRASDLGDRAWSQLLGRFFESARKEVSRYRGRVVKTTGDGLLATFDGPTRAVRCAAALRDEARSLGIDLRAGLHTGECVLKADDIQGIAVHIAARVGERAGDGEVLVSGTVRDLSVGSDLRFRDRGTQALRGVDGEWRTYSLDDS
jgi:class 3 adenylate cyclase